MEAANLYCCCSNTVMLLFFSIGIRRSSGISGQRADAEQASKQDALKQVGSQLGGHIVTEPKILDHIGKFEDSVTF